MQKKLDKWQEEVMKEEGNVLLCTGRRVGKTYIFCKKAVYAMHNKPNTKVIIVSLTEDQAIMINFWMTQIAVDEFPEDIDYNRKPTLKTLTFRNGSNAYVRPVGATGDAARGFECNILYIDEASRMPKLLWEAIKPLTLTTIGKMWMSSTPFCKEGYFWERFDEAYNKKDPDASFKVFYVTTEQVMMDRPISEAWTKEQREHALKQLAIERKEMTYVTYATEYLGMFMDELTQMYSDEILARQMTLQRQKFDDDNYMGVDIGASAKGDPSTFEVIHKVDENIYYHIESIDKKQETPQTEKDIIDYIQIYNINKCGIDTGGVGLPIFQRLLLNDITRSKVVSMSNRTASLNKDGNQKQRIYKEDLHENLLSMLESGELFLLKDEKVRLSLRSVRKEVVINEKTKEKRVIIHGNNTHIAEGLTRAAELAKNEKVNKFRISYL